MINFTRLVKKNQDSIVEEVILDKNKIDEMVINHYKEWTRTRTKISIKEEFYDYFNGKNKF